MTVVAWILLALCALLMGALIGCACRFRKLLSDYQALQRQNKVARALLQKRVVLRLHGYGTRIYRAPNGPVIVEYVLSDN